MTELNIRNLGIDERLESDIRRLAGSEEMVAANIERQIAVRLTERYRHDPVAVGDLVVHRDTAQLSGDQVAEVTDFDQHGTPIIDDGDDEYAVFCSWDLIITEGV